MHQNYDLTVTYEHNEATFNEVDGILNPSIPTKYFRDSKGSFCFKQISNSYKVETGYFIGVDWVITGKRAILVQPKLNSRPQNLEELIKDNEISLDTPYNQIKIPDNLRSVDYFAILQQCIKTDFLFGEIDKIFQINFEAPEIDIHQSQDFLSPLLVAKFLTLLKSIVRKGLKKGYYTKTENLNSKVKGKILIGQNIRSNIVKNRFTYTTCKYQEYGLYTPENRLLKKAFLFANAYISNHTKLFGNGINYIENIANFCRPAFELIGDQISVDDVKKISSNPFFNEYSLGIKLAKLILRRYSYNISNTSIETVSTPPYWINMPLLFELYAYQFLKAKFPSDKAISYQFRTYGNSLDFLVNDKQTNTRMVVDAKYKPIYEFGVNHLDIRQVSGYARLEKVINDLDLKDESSPLIDCLIIYPALTGGLTIEQFKEHDLRANKIGAYRSVYKVGIQLPLLPS